jgi:hypothetical protein
MRKMSRVVARFIPHIVPRDSFYGEESWSEWQDLNLRPPRLERGNFGAGIARLGAFDSAPPVSPRRRATWHEFVIQLVLGIEETPAVHK